MTSGRGNTVSTAVVLKGEHQGGPNPQGVEGLVGDWCEGQPLTHRVSESPTSPAGVDAGGGGEEKQQNPRDAQLNPHLPWGLTSVLSVWVGCQ